MLQLARENPNWGYQRIAGQVLGLGYRAMLETCMGKIMEGSYPPDHPEQVLKQGPVFACRIGKVRLVLTVVPGVADADDPR